MDEALTQLLEADRQHAAEAGVDIFIRAAEAPEVTLFEEMCGEPAGFGPRTLFVIVGAFRRLFVSWPKNVPLVPHNAADLKALLAEATARNMAVVVLDPNRRN